MRKYHGCRSTFQAELDRRTFGDRHRTGVSRRGHVVAQFDAHSGHYHPNILPASLARQHRLRTSVAPRQHVVHRRSLLQIANARQTRCALHSASNSRCPFKVRVFQPRPLLAVRDRFRGCWYAAGEVPMGILSVSLEPPVHVCRCQNSESATLSLRRCAHCWAAAKVPGCPRPPPGQRNEILDDRHAHGCLRHVLP